MPWNRSLSLVGAAALLLAGCTVPAGIAPETADGLPTDFTASGEGRHRTLTANVPEGPARQFRWDFGDGTRAEGHAVEHTYAGDGTYGVTLLVVDGGAPAGASVQTVSVGSGRNAPPEAVLALSSRWAGQGQVVVANIAGTRDPEGDSVQTFLGVQFHGERAPAGGGHAHAEGSPAASAADKTAYRPQENGFDSPVGERYDLRLDKPGLYMYHCHPHPWMTGTVLVQPGAPVEQRPLIMKDAQWFLPGQLTLGPGSTLTWTNEDPVWHTVTLLALHPMSQFLPPGREEVALPDEGVYEITLVARDGRGAMNATSQLVQVTRLPPPTKYFKEWEGTIPAAIPEGTGNHTFELAFPGNATFGFEWSSASPVAKARVDLFEGSRPSGEPLATFTDAAEVRLAAGRHTLRVTAEGGVQVAYRLRVDVVLEPEPDFGGGHGHGGH